MGNIVTGIFVEDAMHHAQNERDTLVQDEIRREKERRKELKEVFEVLDSDKSGFIDFQELEAALEKEDVQALFRMISLDTSDAWNLFKMCDKDGSYSVNIDEFIFGCLQISGNIKHIDMAVL